MWQLLHVSLIFFFSSNFLFKLLSLLIGAHLIGLHSILWMWCNNSAPLPPGDNCVAHKQTDLIETRALTMLPQLTHISILPHIYLSTSECKHYWGTGGRNTRNQLRTKTSCACLAAEYRCGCVSAPPPQMSASGWGCIWEHEFWPRGVWYGLSESRDPNCWHLPAQQHPVGSGHLSGFPYCVDRPGLRTQTVG